MQCGLCVNTCPENAITLVPRLLIGKEAKEAVTLNEAEPFNCVRCAKPFGTRQMVENMLGKLGGHSMFAGGTRRLQMCGDCRVVDMVENKAESTIFDYQEMIAPEDAARANFYGLIARLFYAPPDAALISQLLQAGPMQLEAERNAEAEALATAWREMLEACRSADPEALEGEHTELFVGTGKAAVTPYLSHYVLRHSNDSPLVAFARAA